MKRVLLWGALGAVLLVGAGFGLWIASLPPAPPALAAAPVSAEEQAATVAALRPRRARPVIAVLAASGDTRTETTDFVTSYGILRRADVAEVTAVSTGPGTVRLFPALQVEPDETAAAFDRRHPEGADYVIVPAMSRDDDPAVMAWLKAQSAKGATVVGVCVGAKVVAAAGLLDGHRATTHWFSRPGLLKAHPTIRYVPDRRFVVDGKVATTTGITASMPMMLTLIEAIGGRAKAEATARDLGVEAWDARHASAAFTFSRPFATTVLANLAAPWNRERLGVGLEPGMDEVSLALTADAWSRTYRSRAVSFAASAAPVRSRNGLRIRPDEARGDWPAGSRIGRVQARPAQALDTTLAQIGDRYGRPTADIVAAQLEYPRRASGRDVRTVAAAEAGRPPES